MNRRLPKPTQSHEIPLTSLTTEYLGSKRTLLSFIVDTIDRVAGGGTKRIFDLFSGTGVVSAAFKLRGYSVIANDHLSLCKTLTSALLLNSAAPNFQNLPRRARQLNANPYLSVLAYLNALPTSDKGFIFKNYSPGSRKHIGFERRYFTEQNAAKIDAVRTRIASWSGMLSEAERSLLISDLIRAASSVSNVAGTYGCYLKHWKQRSLSALHLTPSQFVKGRSDCHRVLNEDAELAIARERARIVYADPPYTKRQYAAYYHLLETITRWDKPSLEGTTGLRDWTTHSSDFCYKRRATAALEKLLMLAKCRHFFLSYNEDGQIAHQTLLQLLNSFGPTQCWEVQLRRYRSNDLQHKGPKVTERLYHVRIDKP